MIELMRILAYIGIIASGWKLPVSYFLALLVFVTIFGITSYYSGMGK